MLTVQDLESGYGPIQVLWKPSLHVEKESITSLLGPNASVKTLFFILSSALSRPGEAR